MEKRCVRPLDVSLVVAAISNLTSISDERGEIPPKLSRPCPLREWKCCISAYAVERKSRREGPRNMQRHSLPYCEHYLEDVGSKMFSFNGLQPIRELLGPGVYMVLSHTDEPLYIGMAGNILARISDESHTAIRRAFKEGYRLYVIIARSEAHARGMETELIQKMQPKFNVRGKASQRLIEFYRKRAEQEEKERRDPELMAFRGNFRAALSERLG